MYNRLWDSALVYLVLKKTIFSPLLSHLREYRAQDSRQTAVEDADANANAEGAFD